MATQNTTEDRLRTVAAQIAGFALEDLVRPKRGAMWDFIGIQSSIESIQSFYQEVANSNGMVAPLNRYEEHFQRAKNILEKFQRIRDFNAAEANNPTEARTNLQNQLLNEWHTTYSELAPFLAYSKVSSSGFIQDQQKQRTSLAEFQATLHKLQDEHQTKIKDVEAQLLARTAELDKTLTAAREAAKNAAISSQATAFDTEANECLRASRAWFGGTILTVLVSLVAVFFLFLKDISTPFKSDPRVAVPPQKSAVNGTVEKGASDLASRVSGEVLHQTVARILIMTLLYTAVVWCARNYFASRHNYTVNRHRRNAMQTFRAFVEGTNDKQTQDFILRQAAACAFAPQQSGYLKDESLPAPAPASQIIDVAKSGGGKD